MAEIASTVRERLGNVEYRKYMSYVYNFVTFVSALIVLAICIAIVVLAAIMYPKIKSMYNTIETMQQKVDELLAFSWLDIVALIIQAIIDLIPTSLRTADVQRHLILRLRQGRERQDALSIYHKVQSLGSARLSGLLSGVATAPDVVDVLATLV